MKKKSRSKEIAEKTIFASFQILKEAGGEMRGSEVVEKLRERLTFDEYENFRYEKTGYIRWESILHFFTIDCMKAGYMRKQSGMWVLTKEGEEAMKLGPEKLLSTATKKYREWDALNKQNKESDISQDIDIDDTEEISQKQEALLSQYESSALDGIREFVNRKNPYEFQDLVAELLKAMGYHIALVAPKGRDGGIDIIAYTDPLGVNSPRIIVQVKHRPENNVSSDEIQKLSGTMKQNSDVGIFVTSGDFSNPAKQEATSAYKHIELIDFSRFVKLWIEYYPKMNDEQKNMLPLYPVYFLGSKD